MTVRTRRVSSASFYTCI